MLLGNLQMTYLLCVLGLNTYAVKKTRNIP